MINLMATARPAASGVLVAAITLLLTGCGSNGSSKHAGSSQSVGVARHSASGGGKTTGSTGAVNAGAVTVIQGWSSALRRGDLSAAARYFATPSLLVNGVDAAGQPLAVEIHTLREAEVANAALPCGAMLVSTSQRGRFVNALFKLTARLGPGGSNCADGVGQTARTDFVIANGKIVQWIRAPDDPGDNGSPRTTPTPTTPTPAVPTPTSPTPTLPSPPSQGPPSGGPVV
jgi:hypothetical protein